MNDKNNLLGRWFSDLNIFMFSEFNFMTQAEIFPFISKVMRLTHYKQGEFKSIMKDITPDTNKLPTLYQAALNNSTDDFIEYIKSIQGVCGGPNSVFHGYSDDAIRKLHKHPAELKNVAHPCDTTSPNSVIEPSGKPKPFLGIFITCGSRMANLFGLGRNQIVLIGHYGFPKIKTKDYYLKLSPDFRKKIVDTVMIYSDIVQPSIRLGGEVTNLLDIFTVDTQKTIYKQMARGIYKPLKHHLITQASILITDIDGRIIQFEKDAFTACELQIRQAQ